MTLGTNASQLDRWLGVAKTEEMSALMRDWYGPPIPVFGVPGRVEVGRGGDFRGRIRSGWHSSIHDHIETAAKRYARKVRRELRRSQFATGFATLDALVAAATAGQRITFCFQKAGSAGVVAVTNSLWGLGAMPAAGANASNAPGGDAPTDATQGAPGFTNPGGTDTLHITASFASASVANTLLLYDRLFQVNKTMNSTATEAVTGVPTRYQSSTPNAADSAEGNFLFVEVGGTALAATAHNWTTCLYSDQAGGASTLPSLTGNASAIVRRLDHPVGQWYAPLASGDTGIQKLTQMQCSALVATGVVNFVIGHPLAWMPIPIANIMTPRDHVTGIFGLTRIFNDAALALLEVTKPATTATNYNLCVESVFD